MQQPQRQHQTATSSGDTTAVTATEPAPTTVTSVDRLKHQLLHAYDNGNTNDATDVIIKLEKSNLTREILEMTRVGAVVNDIRKKVAQSAPELSKRCRALIKCWQKLAEPRPTSSASSSANGTPNYASPSLRKGLTPGTPATRASRVTPVSGGSRLTPSGNRRLTPLGNSRLMPAGNTGSRSNATSPAGISNGRTVTPQQKSGPEVSVNTAESGGMRKSYTVGADLARKAVEDSLSTGVEIVRNGKRKAEGVASSDTGITNGLGLSATVAKHPHFNSAQTSPATPHQSLLAARRANVKSTSELVAQLTENLPGYLSIDISNNHNDDGKGNVLNRKGQADLNTGQTLASSATLTVQPEVTKKEKRGRPKKNREKDGKKKDKSASTVKMETTNMRSSTTAADASEQVATNSASYNNLPSSKEVVTPIRNGKYDWNAILPSLETLRHREQLRAKPSTDPRRSYIMNVRGREVLALPYVDVGIPDFLEYKFPESGKFYAEENFMYGAPRPS